MLMRKDKLKADDIVGMLGNGTTFEGVLKFSGTVRIDGVFEEYFKLDG